MPTVLVEKRRRGPFGWVIAILFWAWNALMALWLILGINTTTTHYGSTTTEAGRAGAAIGGTLGIGMILVLWVPGSVILGLMMMRIPTKPPGYTERVPRTVPI